MSFSIQRATSDGSLNTIVLSIAYFDQTDITVFIDDVLLPTGPYTWVWDGADIKITPNVANGSEVLVRRTTKFDDMYHNFDDGAVFNDSTMDDNFRQLLYIFQEGVEGLTATDFYADLNLHGYRLRKVGNAVEPDDAVPFSQYQADALGAGQFKLMAQSAATAAAASQASATASAASATASASSASTSASTATTAASTASTAASTASSAATSASGSATSASTSATNAATSAADAAASAASINPALLVHLAGTETITGAKTFSVSPVVPAGAVAGAAVNKGQLDTVSSSVTAIDTRLTTAEATVAVLNARKMLRRAAKATTSGTSVEFSPTDSTEVPSWAQRVTAAIHAVSTNGTANIQFQLGTSAGFVTTGYLGVADATAPGAGAVGVQTTGLHTERVVANTAGNLRYGKAEFVHMGGNLWVCEYRGAILTGNTGIGIGVCNIQLPGVLDRIRIIADGVTVFDSGSIALLIEGF